MQYARIILLVALERIELSSSRYQRLALPLSYKAILLAVRQGVEPCGPLKALRVSNPLHYRPAHAPWIKLLNAVGLEPTQKPGL